MLIEAGVPRAVEQDEMWLASYVEHVSHLMCLLLPQENADELEDQLEAASPGLATVKVRSPLVG